MPSKDSTNVQGFFVKDVEITSNQDLDENEEIEVLKVPVGEIDEMISANKIRGADSVGVLMIAKLKYPEIFS